MKRQRQGAFPLPVVGELRREIFVADRVGEHSQIGELEEQLVADVAARGRLHDRREQRVGLTNRGEHQRAAVFTGAAGLALASGEDQGEQAQQCGAPTSWHGA